MPVENIHLRGQDVRPWAAGSDMGMGQSAEATTEGDWEAVVPAKA